MADISLANKDSGTIVRKEAANIKEFLAAPAVQKRVNEMLGKRSNQFVTSIISMAGQDNKLANSEPRSLFNAALTAASLDLPINKNLGFAHIIPYEKKRGSGVYEAQFQMGWKGFVQLAQRSGQYKKINAVAVKEGQIIEYDELGGNKYDWNVKGDKTVGYVAFFELQNGFRQELYMTVEELTDHAKQYSQAYKWDLNPKNKYDASSPWSTNFDAMALKTVLKLLLSKWGPLSVDPVMQQAITSDQGVIGDSKVDYIDGNDMLADEQATDEEIDDILDAQTDKSTGEIKEK